MILAISAQKIFDFHSEISILTYFYPFALAKDFIRKSLENFGNQMRKSYFHNSRRKKKTHLEDFPKHPKEENSQKKIRIVLEVVSSKRLWAWRENSRIKKWPFSKVQSKKTKIYNRNPSLLIRIFKKT